MSHKCKICHASTVFYSCPYCGAVPIVGKHIDRATGREIVRGLPSITFRQIQQALTPKPASKRIVRNVTSRLAHRAA